MEKKVISKESKKLTNVTFPQVTLFNRALTIQKGALNDASEIAKNIINVLTNPIDDNEVKIFGFDDEGNETPGAYNVPMQGYKFITSEMNALTNHAPDETFSLKIQIGSDKVVYSFKGGAFSKSLNSIVKSALKRKLQNEYLKATGELAYTDMQVLTNINLLVGNLIGSIGLELKIHDILPIAALLDTLDKRQKAQVSFELSKLINEETAGKLIDFDPVKNLNFNDGSDED